MRKCVCERVECVSERVCERDACVRDGGERTVRDVHQQRGAARAQPGDKLPRALGQAPQWQRQRVAQPGTH